MVHILGVLLPDSQLAKFALTHFYGIGHKTARRLCARVQIHDTCKIRDLSPHQIISLTAFLSSPTSAPPLPHYALASPDFSPPNLGAPIQHPVVETRADPEAKQSGGDRLRGLKIMSELRRETRENIAHQRMIGSYVGRRHAMGLPVRGQNTQSNASTAKKLNRVERYS
ncbi:mitochondrial 30S ribosomal protein S13 [Amylocystis lapponica]|nr:mitochondrial 30S ribosomal protein S13 [Amylocystis lapponica]